MISFFKKKKIVPHIKLSGVIGNFGKFRQGIDFAGQQELIKKALRKWLSKRGDMRILWIEDDPNYADHNYFRSNIFSKHTISPVEDEDDFLFDKAYELIDNNLAQYDYIVIDIMHMSL